MTESSGQTELRLLVVEDESLIAMEFECLLEDLGHLGIAGTPDGALRLLSELSGQIDAVVLDANLGGRSAAPVAHALRARSVPFVIASGYEPAELRHLGFEEAGVGKPYSREAMRQALDRLR